LEVERLFSRNWVAVGFASSLPQSGDMSPLEIFGFPIFLVRGEDNNLRVFHNIGAHDACTVVLERRNTATDIVGPYHGWRYNLQGQLIEAPYWDGTPSPNITSLRDRGCDLKEIRSQVWQDIVFMDLSGACNDLENHLSPVLKLFEDHELDSFQLAFDALDGDGIQRLSPKANWKTLWENYAVNVLHAGFVHEQYRRSPDMPMVDEKACKTFEEINDGVLKGLGFATASVTGAYPSGPSAELPKMLRKSDGVPIDKSYILNIYPNLCFLVFPTRIRIGILVPKSSDNSEWLIASYFAAEAANSLEFRELREQSQAASLKAQREDDAICEAVQRARRSPAHRNFIYSPFWEAMHHDFNNMVLDDLEQPGLGISNLK
jgi:choline monooxygenase